MSAQTLNDHYATISTDHSYTEPRAKLTAAHGSCCLISEFEVFVKLDSLRPTATGLDAIPAWFLRVGAPAFAAPLATLLNQSMSAGVSFPSNGKLPPSRQSSRLPSQLSAANSDLSQLHQFCHVSLNDTSSRHSFILQSNIPHTHSVSLTSTVLGPLALQLRRSLPCSTLCVTCCQPITLCTS